VILQWGAFIAACVWLYRGELAACAVWLCVAETFARHASENRLRRDITKVFLTRGGRDKTSPLVDK